MLLFVCLIISPRRPKWVLSLILFSFITGTRCPDIFRRSGAKLRQNSYRSGGSGVQEIRLERPRPDVRVGQAHVSVDQEQGVYFIADGKPAG